jgi:hypothetical protein
MKTSSKVSINRLAVVGTAVVCVLVILASLLPIQFGISTGGMLSISLRQVSANPDWLDSDWGYYKQATVTNASASYQTKILVGMRSDGWVEYGSNPIFQKYGSGWEKNDVADPCVLKEDTTYRMWYNGADGSYTQEGYAYSSAAEGPFIRGGNNPVLERGGSGAWDEIECSKISVVHKDNYYYGVYSGWASNGTRALGWAYKTDADPSGKFTKGANNPILQATEGWEDNYLDGPYLRYCTTHSRWELWYGAGKMGVLNEPENQCFAYCSGDPSVPANWTKYSGNPIVTASGSSDWNGQGLGGIKLYDDAGTLYGIYCGCSNESINHFRLGLVTLTDETTWNITPQDLIVGLGVMGTWNAKHIYTGTLMKDGSTWKLWLNASSGSTEAIGLWEYTANLTIDVACDGHCKYDFSDLRFTGSDGTTLLDYWIESISSSLIAAVWVENDATPSTTCRMYYGNADATAVSNGDNTFIFFDHFDGTYPGSKWTGDTGYGSVASSILTMGSAASVWKVIYGATAQGSVTGALRASVLQSSAKYSWVGFDNGTNAHRAYRYIEPTPNNYILSKDGTTQTTVASNWTYDAYKIIDIIVIGATNVRAFENEVEVTGSPKTTNPPNSSSIKATVAAFNTATCILVDWILQRKYVATEPTWGSWGGEQEYTLEITNTPDSKDFGVLAVNTSSNTTIGYFTITNTGNCNVDITIQGTDLTGGDDTWDLADNGSPGENIYGLYAGLDDGSPAFDIVVRETATYNTLVSGLVEDATQDWGLKLYMPTSLSGYDAQQMSGTVTLVASAS